jgi:two-component sensor histidine kinase
LLAGFPSILTAPEFHLVSQPAIASNGSAQSGPDRPPRPIAVYLFVLALVALVPAFAFSAVLLQRNNEAQERVVETLVTGTARSIVQAVEREITANVTTLRVLSTAPALLEGDYESFYNRVKVALEGTESYVYLLDSNLMSIISTRVPFGESPRPSADPESGRQALESRNVVISNVVFGSVSQQWVFNVLQPIFIDGRDPMILGLSRNAEGLAEALLSNKLPDGWNVALIDGRGQIVAASPDAGTPGEHLALADLTPITTSAGWIPVKSETEDYLAVVQRSSLTGWTLYAWAPRALIAQPLASAFWSLLVGGVLLAAVVVLIIYWVSLQIGRSVHGLEDDAKLLGAGETVPARDYPISEIATVSQSIADASRRRRAAETEVRLLMRELAHRSKNQMTVIAAMAKQSAKGADSVPEYVSGFEKRIYSLARSTDLLLAHGPAGIDIREVLARQIDPLCPLDSGRVTLNGPLFVLNTQSAQILGMAAHELATNAVKHGAFSTETGRLEVTWHLATDWLELVWRERMATQVEQPRRRGFGTTVLETMVGRSLGADVSRILNEDGIEWRFVIPLAALDVHADPQDADTPAEPAPQPAVAATGSEN